MASDPIDALIEHGEEHGCINMTELYEAINVTDACSRVHEEDVSYTNETLAGMTADALQLFLNEIGRYPLLTAAQEVELAKRIERGDPRAKEQMINSNLRLG